MASHVKYFKVKRNQLVPVWLEWQLLLAPGTGFVSLEDFEKSITTGSTTCMGKPIKVIE